VVLACSIRPYGTGEGSPVFTMEGEKKWCKTVSVLEAVNPCGTPDSRCKGKDLKLSASIRGKGEGGRQLSGGDMREKQHWGREI